MHPNNLGTYYLWKAYEKLDSVSSVPSKFRSLKEPERAAKSSDARCNWRVTQLIRALVVITDEPRKKICISYLTLRVSNPEEGREDKKVVHTPFHTRVSK